MLQIYTLNLKKHKLISNFDYNNLLCKCVCNKIKFVLFVFAVININYFH